MFFPCDEQLPRQRERRVTWVVGLIDWYSKLGIQRLEMTQLNKEEGRWIPLLADMVLTWWRSTEKRFVQPERVGSPWFDSIDSVYASFEPSIDTFDSNEMIRPWWSTTNDRPTISKSMKIHSLKTQLSIEQVLFFFSLTGSIGKTRRILRIRSIEIIQWNQLTLNTWEIPDTVDSTVVVVIPFLEFNQSVKEKRKERVTEALNCSLSRSTE